MVLAWTLTSSTSRSRWLWRSPTNSADGAAGRGIRASNSITTDVPKPDGRAQRRRIDHNMIRCCGTLRFHASADPGRPTNIHMQGGGWPNQQFALVFVDLADRQPGVQSEHLAVAGPPATRRLGYGLPRKPWSFRLLPAVLAWAVATDWRP